jgi:hypothetical protein
VVAGSNPVHPTKKGTSASTQVEAELFRRTSKSSSLEFARDSKQLKASEMKWRRLMLYAFAPRIIRKTEQSDVNPNYNQKIS